MTTTNQFSYNPGSDFQPYVAPKGTSPQEIQDEINTQIAAFNDLSGFEALYFYFTKIVPLQMDLEGAVIDQVSAMGNDFTNLENYMNMLKEEFSLSKPGAIDTDHPEWVKDWTPEFRAQLLNLESAISADKTISNEDKQNLLQPIFKMQNVVATTSLSQIWQSAYDPTNPNSTDVKTMLAGFDQLTTTLSTISGASQASLQYNINEFNKYVNYEKKTLESEMNATKYFVSHMLQS